MDRDDVVCIYNGLSFSHKKEIMLFVTTWIKLEGIILSEASQTEKDKHYVISQSQSLRNRLEQWLPEAENGENREMLGEG